MANITTPKKGFPNVYSAACVYSTNLSHNQYKYSPIVYLQMLYLKAAGGLILSSGNPVDFHTEIW